MLNTYLDISEQDKDTAIALGAQLDFAGQLFVPRCFPLTPFKAWLPAHAISKKAAVMAVAVAEPQGVTLSALLNRCSIAVKAAFTDPVWVRIEVSQLKYSGGHLYLGAVERSEAGGKEVAKSTAMIWKSNVSTLVNKFSAATGMELAAGIQILVLAKPEFNVQYGLSLQIIDLDPNYTLGDREARLKRIRSDLLANGEGKLNLSLSSPDDFHHVCVISPDGASGLEDFQAVANLLVAAGLCKFTYFKALFQGDKAKVSIKQAMIDAHKAHQVTSFDALAIIRGGGAASDLHWLDEYVLARMVCRFHCPVFTGIGHEKDKSILDEYAHRAFGTPSKVITHIKECITNKAAQGFENWNRISQLVTSKLDAAEAKTGLFKIEIDTGAEKRLDQVEFTAEKLFTDMKVAASTAIHGADAKIGLLNHAIVTFAATTLSTAAANVENNFSSVNLAVRRSIDGIEGHLDSQFQSVLSNVANLSSTAEINVDRHFSDVRFYACKSVDDAESSSKDLMAGILAHGVEPTLRRGFALVRNAQGPVSTKIAAENSTDLEIVFRDGTMKIFKEEVENG